MSELANFLSNQPMLALFATMALGHAAGAVSIKGFSLGSGAVLFVALAVGAFAPASAMPSALGSLGLLLFLYGVGLAYGQQFFDGLTSPVGLRANAASIIGVVIMALMTVGTVWLFPDISLPETLGVFAGAGTSTSSLQAAMALTGNNLPATGYSVAYPFGVAIPILVIGLYNAFFRPRIAPQERISLKMHAVRVENGYVVGKTLLELANWLPQGVAASTVYRDGQAHSAEVHGPLQLGDVVLITGVDIVQEQIRIAGGLPLQYKQKDIHIEGHAFECRINAEDPYNFIPSPGLIESCHLPGGFGIRVDSHIYQGYRIPPYYDSLIGKVCVIGKTREQAMAKMRVALAELAVTGIKTNTPLHRDLFSDPGFEKGGVSIHYLEHWLEERKAKQDK